MKAVMSKSLAGVLKNTKGRDELRQGLLKVAASGKVVLIDSNGKKFKLARVARKAA